jgi:uncharacterized protein YjgD (DUF1641 family)
MNKILVSAAVLQQIFKEHPEVEVELVGSATAQIAGRMAQTLAEKLPTAQKQIEAALAAQVAGIKSNTRLHPEVKQLIRDFIAEQCASEIKLAVSKEVTEQALVRVNELVKAQMLKVDEMLRNGVATAAEAWAQKIKSMAEQEFLALVRGVKLGGEA